MYKSDQAAMAKEAVDDVLKMATAAGISVPKGPLSYMEYALIQALLSDWIKEKCKDEPTGPMTRQKNGMLNLPEGYFFCSDCQALTPHKKVRFNEFECVVCGNCHRDDYHTCPNCHNDTECLAEEPSERVITVHGAGCHCQESLDSDWSYAERVASEFIRDLDNQRTKRLLSHERYYALRERAASAYHEACGCPQITIYSNTAVTNHQSWSEWSVDCMDAIGWSFDVMCPVCGCVFEHTDSNC